MIVVTLYGKDTYEISQIVKELKDKGLSTGKDFDFEFSTGKFDWTTVQTIPAKTTFKFYNEKEGTWFALQWM